ncbi:YbfB/YjiJ family MFS transporter [Acidiphilium iwatense]|uniref:YbfB/YjiJ family MFS transporter n=2 Tax=Acidiphilium iwatense TaxID=768198 RepID=A0ABS9DZ82_9PROT|nr:YbfB/YjiJ family MFS transporter [Acidiphilium iwatense]
MMHRAREMPFDVTSGRDIFVPALGGLIALAVGIGIGRFVYTPILPVMAAGLGLSKFSIGLIASANFAGYLVGALLASRTSLPGTRRLWLLIGLGGSAATTAAMGLVQSMWAFVALRFLGGIASALVLVFTSALLLDFMAHRGRAGFSAILFAGVGAGIAVSAVLVSSLRATGQSWQTLWLASGLLSVVGAFAAGQMIPTRTAVPVSETAECAPPPGRPLLGLVLAYGFFGFGYVITATFLVAIVRGNPAIRELEPLVWVIFGLSAAPSVALWNWLATRLTIPGAFALAALVEAVGVLASVGWSTTTGVFAASVCVGGTFMGLTALGLMRGRELARGNARQVLGLMTSAFGVGQILGPSFAGLVFDRTGSFIVPSIVAAIALAVAAALVLIQRRPSS